MEQGRFSNALALRISVVFFFLSLVGGIAKGQVPTFCGDVMLQAFDYYPTSPAPAGPLPGYGMSWSDSKWTTLNAQASEIAESFQMIWLPPSGNPYAGAVVNPSSPTMGYLPVYWFNQNSTFGTQAELVTLISNLKSGGCKAIADIVINHRNGEFDWCTFPTETYKGVTYTPNSSWICTDDESRASAPAGCNNPTGAADEGEKYAAARDLDHSNIQVRNAVNAYLDFLKTDIGYSGWRYDVASGYAPSHIGEYDDNAAGYFSVGEVLNTDYNVCETFINGTSKKSAAFDFPAKGAIDDAFSSGDYTKLVWKFLGTTNQPAGLIHNPDLRRYAVTFVENHDTYRYGLPFNGNVLAANAFIIASPGVPCVFLPHWKMYKSTIKQMIAARRSTGVNSQSSVTVLQTASNIYAAKSVGTNGELIVKVGPGSYSAPADFNLACSGTDWAIWTKIISIAPVLSVSPIGGTYIGGTTVTLTTTGGIAPVKIYYTTDGTTPTASSTLYTTALAVNSYTTLKAVAIDNLGQTTPVASHTYITKAAPSVSISPASGTYIGGTTVTLSSTNGETPIKIYYTADGTTPTSASTLYAAPFSVTANNTVVKAIAIDAAGQTSSVVNALYTIEPPQDAVIRFRAPDTWSVIYVESFDAFNSITGAWPGVEIVPDVDGYCTFNSFEGYTVRYNNGTPEEQTEEIINIPTLSCHHATTTYMSGGVMYYLTAEDDCLATTQQSVQQKDIAIYPNPATTMVKISADDNIERVYLYDVSGGFIRRVEVNSMNTELDVVQLSSGYYTVVLVLSSGEERVLKFIKR